MAALPSDSAQASLIIVDAVERFRQSLSAEHKREIETTSIKDVIDAIAVIQQDLLKRRANRNLRKLQPFVQALGNYGDSLNVIINGLSPYMPFIWGPIKVTLQIASDYLGAFDKLLDAYDRISTTIPRTKELGEAAKASPALLPKLALYYADILEFHSRAYKFVTMKSWRFFFLTTWASFDNRFHSILASMARNSDSIHDEALAIDLIQSKKWRDESFALASMQEKDRLGNEYDSVVAWLNTDRLSHEDHRDRLLSDFLPGSCDWVKNHTKIKHWLDAGSKSPVVWVHGKPGAGKTVISASLVEHLQGLEAGMTAVYYFCSHFYADTSSKILKSFVLQLINVNPDMAAVIHTNYVQKHREPSVKVLKLMLCGTPDNPGLLSCASPCRIIVDGVDECASQEQKPILQDLLQLVSASAASNTGNCKLLVSSRDLPEISRVLKNKVKAGGIVPLSEEKDSIDQTIAHLSRSRLSELASERETWPLTDEWVSELCVLIVQKADGMMLWVKLVLDTLSEVDTLRELHNAIMGMPRELSELYQRILASICGGKDHNVVSRSDRTMRILGWLVHAKRPLKKHEVLTAVALTAESSTSSRWDMPDDSAINRCIKFDSFSRLPFNRSMALSCSLALRNGLDLLDPEISEEDRLLMVLDGSHAMIPYAVDFWLEHLLGDETAEPISSHNCIGIVLGELEQRHRNLWSKTKQGAEWTEGVNHAVAQDPRLQAVSSTPVLPLCSTLMVFRADRKKKNAADGREFEKLSIADDPTLFTSLSTTFYYYVAMLLERAHRDTHGIPTAKLVRFMTQYSQCSHPCRFSPCTSLFVGFPSETLRTAHEKLHVSRLFCVRSTCAIGRLGFQNQRDLASHNQRYHEEGGILVPPRVRKVVLPAADTVRSNLSDSIQLPNAGEADMNPVDRSKAKEFSLSFDKERTEVGNHRHRGGPGPCVIFNRDVDRAVDFDHLFTVSFGSVVCCVRFSPDSSLVAIGSKSFAAILDVDSGKLLYRLDIPGHGDTYVRGVAFHPTPTRNTLAVVADDKLLRVWDYAANTSKVGSGHEQDIYAVCYAPNGEFVATVCSDRTLRLWHEIVRGAAVTVSEKLKCVTRDGLTCVTVTRNSNYVIVGSLDKSCLVYNATTGLLMARFGDAHDSIYGVATSLNGNLLAVASLDKSIFLYDIQAFKIPPVHYGFVQMDRPFEVLKYHEDYVLGCSFSIDGNYVFSSSKDRGVICWNVHTGAPVALLGGYQNSVIQTDTTQRHDMNYIAIASGDFRVQVWRCYGTESSQGKMKLRNLLSGA